MGLTELRNKIERRQALIGVIGLGYVGLPVAAVFARAGFSVVGLDTKTERVAAINSGHSPIEGKEPGLAELLEDVVHTNCLRATTDYASLGQADVVLIAVETPVDLEHKPQYSALQAACRDLGQVMKPGVLVIVESTIAPGTMERVVRPLLEETSGLRLNDGFYLGHCPERVMPGKLLANLRGVSRVCGGSTPETAEVMVALYGHIVEADLDPTDCVTAELVKTAENAYRDVNIAFANELAQACAAAGGDFLQVRELVNKSPGRNVLMAGGGVGGHCIPKDPWLLAHSVDGLAPLQLIPAARAVNDGMPLYVVELARQALRKAGCELAGARVAVLGLGYREDSADMRNSPSVVLADRLKELGATMVLHDPWVAEYSGDVLERVAGCDAVVVMVAHSGYQELDLTRLRAALRLPVLIDARRVFDAAQARSAGLIYRAVGLG